MGTSLKLMGRAISPGSIQIHTVTVYRVLFQLSFCNYPTGVNSVMITKVGTAIQRTQRADPAAQMPHRIEFQRGVGLGAQTDLL